LIEHALKQHQDLQNKYQAQKGKSQDEIVNAAKEVMQLKNLIEPEGGDSSAPEARVCKYYDPSRDPELFFRVVKTKSEVYDIITRSFTRH